MRDEIDRAAVVFLAALGGLFTLVLAMLFQFQTLDSARAKDVWVWTDHVAHYAWGVVVALVAAVVGAGVGLLAARTGRARALLARAPVVAPLLVVAGAVVAVVLSPGVQRLENGEIDAVVTWLLLIAVPGGVVLGVMARRRLGAG